jgi:chromosome partitioning protein
VIVVFLNLKGGCGKSTSAVHLSRYLLKRNKQVVLLDADPQQTSIDWIESFRPAIPRPEYRCVIQSKALQTELHDCPHRFDVTIVDSPPGIGRLQRILLLFADVVMIPVQPGIPDLRATLKLLKAVRLARGTRRRFEPTATLPAIGKPEFKAFTFLVRTVPNALLVDKARMLLRDRDDAYFLETDIPQRQILADAMGIGATVFDVNTRPARQAAESYRRLFELAGL